MYQDKISQIKFYYRRYCSRKWKTFNGKIEQKILRSLILVHMLQDLARCPASTRKMYQNEISQIKFYYQRYCSRKRKTFSSKIEQKILWSLILVHMLQDLARCPAATCKMYQDKISQIKFYCGRYCSRKRKTFGGKIEQKILRSLMLVHMPDVLPPLAKRTGKISHKWNSTTVGIVLENEENSKVFFLTKIALNLAQATQTVVVIYVRDQ